MTYFVAQVEYREIEKDVEQMKSSGEISRFIVAIGRGQATPPELTKNRKKTDIVKNEGGEVVSKRCNKCIGMTLKVDMLADKRKKDEMASICIECNKEKAMKRLSDPIERAKHNERNRERRSDPIEKAKENERKRELYSVPTTKTKVLAYQSERRSDPNVKAKINERQKKCYDKKHSEDPTPFRVKNANRRAMKAALHYTLTTKQLKQNESFFNCCPLTGDPLTSCELEHALPLIIGHGGTTKENCYPLRSDLNRSKGDRNIFEWFEANGERLGIDPKRFERLISWLAKNHGLTVEQYREFVFYCHDNRRTLKEVKADERPSLEIWKETRKAVSLIG